MKSGFQASRSLTFYLEKVGELLLVACAIISIVTTCCIIAILGKEAFAFFSQVPLTDFFFGGRWEPVLEPKSFGVLPLVCGTVLILVGSLLVALPIGIGTGVYLSEFASEKTRAWIKPILEILSGIPTVVFGYFALTYITPLLQEVFPSVSIFNAASASIVVGIMIIPLVSSLCDDAFRSVPRSIVDGGYAMGATSFEVIMQVLIPYARGRVLGATILAMSRALGETMAVTLAAGATPVLTLNPGESIQTMTAYIVQIAMGDLPYGGVEYLSSFAVGALLFLMTFSLNWLAYRIARKSIREAA